MIAKLASKYEGKAGYEGITICWVEVDFQAPTNVEAMSHLVQEHNCGAGEQLLNGYLRQSTRPK